MFPTYMTVGMSVIGFRLSDIVRYKHTSPPYLSIFSRAVPAALGVSLVRHSIRRRGRRRGVAWVLSPVRIMFYWQSFPRAY